jgi:hypothetical protein
MLLYFDFNFVPWLLLFNGVYLFVLLYFPSFKAELFVGFDTIEIFFLLFKFELFATTVLLLFF